MSRREIFHCDSCGVELPQQQTVSIWMDRRLDAAGSPDDEYEYRDLCFNCLRIVAEKLLKEMPNGEKREVLRRWSRAKTTS
jgi:hypothetical protein